MCQDLNRVMKRYIIDVQQQQQNNTKQNHITRFVEVQDFTKNQTLDLSKNNQSFESLTSLPASPESLLSKDTSIIVTPTKINTSTVIVKDLENDR